MTLRSFALKLDSAFGGNNITRIWNLQLEANKNANTEK